MVNSPINTDEKTPKTESTVKALWHLEKVILDTLEFKEVVQRTVDSILTELGYLNLGYRIIVLALLDKNTKTLKRIAISQTPEGKKALANTPVPFSKIDIPLSAEENLCVRVLISKQPGSTDYWPDILCPAFTKEDAIKIQQVVGIKTSLVYPVVAKNEAIGIMIFSLIKSADEVTPEEKDLIAGFTDIVGLAVQNAKLYSSLEEITERLKMANEKLKSLDQLKDEFVSLASHELRTPMTAIKSYLWLVLRQSPDMGTLTEKQKLYIERTYISTERLIKLVKDMLNVSRIESGRLQITMKPLDIVALVKDVITEVTPEAQNQQLTVAMLQPEHQLPLVNADQDKIKEVLINLIGNALKFTPAGGKITISFSQKEHSVITHVADTGKGIKKEDMSKLFQKFGLIESTYATNPEALGTGLGLYISKSIIEMHGGVIWVESEGENKGTTFSFSLRESDNTTQQQ